MIIQLSKDKGQDFEFHLNNQSVEPFGDEYEGEISSEGIDIRGHIRRLNKDQCAIEFELNGIMLYPCARCLEQIPTEVLYTFNETVDLSDETDTVDLIPFVEECLFINEPYKMLCKEECKGLCPGCGVNLNHAECQCEETIEIDPRFEALKQLL